MKYEIVLMETRLGKPKTEQVVATCDDHRLAAAIVEACKTIYVIPAYDREVQK